MEFVGQPKTALTIPCCLCGTLIHPNAANQCGACLAQQFDLKQILQRGPGGGDLTIHQCRKCRRYEHTETYFQHHEAESPGLLALCLKNIPALNNYSQSSYASKSSSTTQSTSAPTYIKLMDSMWIWTEPHCMRLKLRLTVHAEVGDSNPVTIEQKLPVEFYVKFNQCPECNRTYTNRTWSSIVQIRQKQTQLHATNSSPRKGLLLLEMAIAKNAELRKHVLQIQTTRNGFDFYFLQHMHAQSFASYLAKNVAPMRLSHSQKLVSEDVRNNSANVKHTTVCNLVPLCREDLVVCDRRILKEGSRMGAGGSGRLCGRLCLVEKITTKTIRLVDASPPRSSSANTTKGDKNTNTSIEDLIFAELHTEKYWKGEKFYSVLFGSDRLVRFVVLDVDLCNDNHHHNYDNNNDATYKGPNSGVEKYAMADVEVVRESDFGSSDETFYCTTHLGNLLQPGDVVLGYDLVTSVIPGFEFATEDKAGMFNSNFSMPDVVLVKKAKVKSNNNDDDDMDLMTEKKKGRKKNDDDDGQRKKERAKSSGSKKRERRMRKEEKKAKEFQATVARMGFVSEEAEEGGENHDAMWNDERKAFEAELLDDPELAEELNEAERALGDIAFEDAEQKKDGTNSDNGNSPPENET